LLGIRKFNGVAIDLFQGDISTFSCDHEFVAHEGGSIAGVCETALKEIVASNGRHLAVSVILTEQSGLDAAAIAAMNAVKRFLGNLNDRRGLRRLTFVLTSGDGYRAFQNALFTTFLEDDA
jgi:hypothetical protein